MQPVAWYQRTPVVVALLLIVPPVGIALVWRVAPWNRNPKIAATVLSTAWLIFAIVRAQTRKSEERPEASVPALTASTILDAGAAAPREVPDATSPPAEAALAEREPRLLVPVELPGFTLWSGEADESCCGVTAQYLGVGDVGKHLVAKVYVRKDPREVLPALDKEHRAIKIGEHDGVIFDVIDETRATVIWFSEPWQHVVNVEYERPRDLPAARKAAEQIAPIIAIQSDRYLTGTSPPSAQDQKQHLAVIQAATDAARQQAEADRLKQGPTQFVAKLEDAGITNDIVARVGRDDVNPEELVITVGRTWHVMPRQDRLMAAQNLWKLWSSINTPAEPDTSRIRIVDANGNTMGGSRLGAGSMIKVQD